MVTKNVKKLLSAVALKYQQALVRSGVPVNKILVFGSQAKGTAKKWSDIDLCVVSPIFGKNRFDERLRLFHISSQIDTNIEPHPYNEKDLFNKWDPLAKEIRKYGVILFSNFG